MANATIVNFSVQSLQPVHLKAANWTAQQIAELVGGTLSGDGLRVVSDIRPLPEATSSDLSFFSPTNAKGYAELLKKAESSAAGVLLVRERLPSVEATQIVVSDPLSAIAKLATLLRPKPLPEMGIHPAAIVHPSAKLGTDVRIGPLVVIGEDVAIGNRTVIHPNVVIYRGARIGDDCVIHAGAILREDVLLGNDCLIQNGVVLGGDGFGYFSVPGREHRRIPHIGRVVLSDHVDIGANSTVDRATLGETRIGEGTKVDNLVMIGHNVQVGKLSFLCGQVGISGSSQIGSNVILSGQVGVADHVQIGDKVRVAAKSGVSGDIDAGTDAAGIPARKASLWRRQQVILTKLPELIKKLSKIGDE